MVCAAVLTIGCTQPSANPASSNDPGAGGGSTGGSPTPRHTSSRARTSPPGEIVYVSVNQSAELPYRRPQYLRLLAEALRSRLLGASGRLYVPDVVILYEVDDERLSLIQRFMNRSFASNFEMFASGSTEIKAKTLVNMTTTQPLSARTWGDVCLDDYRSPVLRFRERSSSKSFAIAGAHIPALSTHLCKERNVVKLRETLAQEKGPVLVGGDFNKRAVAEERECDPYERGPAEKWWTLMTSASTADDMAFTDAVRQWARVRGVPPGRYWTYEGDAPVDLCDGSTGFRRSRIDYIFASEGVEVLEAYADDPGWAGPEPGRLACARPEDCRYSDHRYVWTRAGI